MNVICKIKAKIKLSKYKKKGLKVGKTTRFVDVPNFGSEPYLIEIGENNLISFGCTFINHDGSMSLLHNQELFKDRYKDVFLFGKIIIGDNCFIGANVTILKGVTIGNNVIVGAGSIVTKNIPDNSVVAGIPARKIMSLEEYAEKCKKTNPKYDYNALKFDKKSELIRILNK